MLYKMLFTQAIAAYCEWLEYQIGIRRAGEIGDCGSAVATPNGSSRKEKKKKKTAYCGIIMQGVSEVLGTFQVLIAAELWMVVRWNWYHFKAKIIKFFVMLMIFQIFSDPVMAFTKPEKAFCVLWICKNWIMDTCSTCISHKIPKRGTRKEVHIEMAW